MGAPSKEEIERNPPATLAGATVVIVAIADEVERLRKDLEIAEQSRDAWMADRERIAGKNELLRAEVLALLDSDSIRTSDYCDGADGDDEPISEECYDETPCQAHRLAALLAKLRGAP